MKIGVFGGTFNPPHKGHVRLANTAAEMLGLDKMIIIPSCIPPHKIPGSLARGEDRLEMCRLAFCKDSRFEISSMELDRDRFYNARLNGPGATTDKPSLKITFSAPKQAE